ncbi:interferon alpha-inducible protein 27-like protein 2B [Bos javanicus]|uniref:interferon alpha-inducible protein 27-like protein 2B n=1 Tax=Bos javanicus TaxID=9906 RepID=UPI002AA948A6|nr:interferon alpha-inducible protein 27-like protein 2B [Bos javanicus]XP_061251177.1 interferon alpha-inducible protein 27-like protein 2B [Bos javanicus]XP_061251178.1 interferon alpha-inducible protein 27-like protein 2B [Bos javanicus]
MEFTKAVRLASNLASKILSAGSLAKVGGAASSSVLARLSSLGLTLPSSTALAGATSTLGSLVGTLKGSFLLGSPAAALSTLPVGGLTLPSSTALAGATSTLGSLVGTLKGSFLLGSPAAALSTLPVGGLTLPSSTALAGATSTLGSLVGTLKGSFLLGSPAAALSTLPVGAKAAAAVVGGASTVAAVPMVLSAVGFTSAGITASSLAAKMMSISAIANGGGVAAGSLVATLQSVGASGLCLSSKLLVGIAGSTLVSKFLGL